jgi:iron complex outermembrane receptor protein
MNIEVTSVSRKAQNLSRTPAAVYVITQEDIRRSGAATIPDVLRMAPGVQVAQIDANRWAISVRGFNDLYSNKLLVLVDGRTVYSPGFSGVFWDEINVPLDTIERIEVVRGPGGSVWGANAVNGVINIITKNSSQTQGGYALAGAGSEQTAGDEVRYGGRLGTAGYYRAFGQYSSFSGLLTPQGLGAWDAWRFGHEGIRADWTLKSGDSVMLEADALETHQGNILMQDIDGSMSPGPGVAVAGGNIQARWNHRLSGGSDTTLQVYDSTHSRLDSGIRQMESTADIDFQHHLNLESKQDIVWGGGFRSTYESLTNGGSDAMGEGAIDTLLGYTIAFRPPARTLNLFSGFAQDEIALASNVSLTMGVRLEHNSLTGFENEPTARLAWLLDNSQALWLAASKAVRQPSVLESDLDVNAEPVSVGNGFAIVAQMLGNPQLRSETVRDYEAGYRIAPGDRISADFTGFYSIYHDLSGADITPAFLEPGAAMNLLMLPFLFQNMAHADDYGAEAAVDWQVSKRWKLQGTYSWLKMNVQPYSPAVPDFSAIPGASMLLASLSGTELAAVFQSAAGTFSASPATIEGSSPRNQAGMRSYLDLTSRLDFDTSVYFVGRLPARAIPAYTRLDGRLAWKLNEKLEASLVGQNLLTPYHLEFGSIDQAVATEIPRAVLGRIIWIF